MTQTTCKIYQIDCTEAYQMSEQGTGYSLEPWGRNTAYYQGGDDGGKEYRLPDGYTVGMDGTGSQRIYNPAGNPCDLVGRNYPALIDHALGPKATRLAKVRLDWYLSGVSK